MKTHGVLDAFNLKLIMLVLMLLDHMYEFLFPRELLFAHYLARVVAPVFAFLMTQGMVYTRSRSRYVLGLFTAGALMAAGNLILYFITKRTIPNNIFISLAIGAALIYAVDELKRRGKILWAVIIFILALSSFYCEGGYIVPLMSLIFYYLRHKPALMHIVYVLALGLPFILIYFESGRMQPQFYMIFAVFPIMLYNGRRGADTAFAKYMFYIFYPLHVWILFIISQLLA